jgi:hypothetical protein
MDMMVEPATRERPSAPGRLPADLVKLRDRYLCEFPDEAARVERLAQVPSALRHILSLRLELNRTDVLPRHYRSLAQAAFRMEIAAQNSHDAVDRLVIAYARAARLREGDAGAALMPQLRRYFAEPQVVELALVLVQTQAMALFDTLLA